MVASSIIGAFGNLASTGLQAAWNASSNKRAYHYQRNLMHLQNELNRSNQEWQFANAPSLARQGFEAAGYNPILALSNLNSSPSNASLGGVTQAGSIESDLGGSATNAYRAYKLERERNTAEVNATNASASLAREQAKTEDFRRQMLQSQTFLNNIDHSLKTKELSWYDKRQLQELRSMYINSQANMLGAQASMNQAHSARMIAQSSSEYQRSQRDLNTLEYHIKSPKAWNRVNHSSWYNNGFEDARRILSTVRGGD